MGEGGSNDVFGWFSQWHLSRGRGRRFDQITPSTRPTMNRGTWLRWALVCTTTGVGAGLLLAGWLGWSQIRLAVIGGLIALVAGMVVVETIWERALHAAPIETSSAVSSERGGRGGSDESGGS